jgi:chromosomal replication initiator protein
MGAVVKLHAARAAWDEPLPSLGEVARIQNIVALSYGLAPEDMRSKAMDRAIAWPRQVAMYLAREITGKSTPCLGRMFGRDHSTIIFSAKAVEQRMKTDPIYRADVEELRRRIEG